MPRTKVDYATDQITVYRYCPYRCTYCYVWNNKLFASRVMRGRYDPVEEAKKYLRKRGKTIVVSFASDPYPPEEEEKQLTRRVLEVLCRGRNRVLVLTKNPGLALRDIDVMKRGDCWLGTTIVTDNPVYARVLEPRAPSVSDRLIALARAVERGIKTWASVEPIIPYATYPENIVRLLIGIGVSYVVLGAYNYWNRITLPEAQYMVETEWKREMKRVDFNPYSVEVLRMWYREHVPEAIKLLEKHGVEYHVKKELAELMANRQK